MKKTAVVTGLAVVVGLLLIGSMSAYACWGNYGYGNMYGPGMGYANPQNQKFAADTAELRETLAQKRSELRTEYSKPSPDEKRIARLEGESAALYAKIDSAANRYDMPRMHHGYGMGYGYDMPCW